MKKIADIFSEKKRTFSFEFFPPKTEKGMEKLYEIAESFAALKPDWFSVTYGAGGGTRELTLNIVDDFQKRFGIPTMHHFSCVGDSRDALAAKISEIKSRDIRNIFALRGDPPVGVENWQSAADGCEYCYQLIELIRKHDDFFSIGVAGFPEGHINCPDKAKDSKYLKKKIDSGGDFVITQIFFDNKDYFEYVDRLRKAGVAARIIPGIMAITDYQKLLSFCKGCGATVPQKVHDIFSPLDGNEEATYKAGVNFTVEQCNGLLEGGAPGIQFFTLNKLDPIREIMGKIIR
ncbi:MAG: methylenetetrahydrofolate reductase [Dehalococcoidales bacterium]|nr:methylenetetrahydrofolate reductase [Dehalococcoidales bacterium]